MKTALLLFTVLIPPPEYDRPYTGRLEIEYVEPGEAAKLCDLGHRNRACADVGNGWCRIIFPKDTGVYSRKTLELLMRHEIAHCNGWRH